MTEVVCCVMQIAFFKFFFTPKKYERMEVSKFKKNLHLLHKNKKKKFMFFLLKETYVIKKTKRVFSVFDFLVL